MMGAGGQCEQELENHGCGVWGGDQGLAVISGRERWMGMNGDDGGVMEAVGDRQAIRWQVVVGRQWCGGRQWWAVAVAKGGGEQPWARLGQAMEGSGRWWRKVESGGGATCSTLAESGRQFQTATLDGSSWA